MVKAVFYLFLPVVLVSQTLFAQEVDVQFVLLGKTANHRQLENGDLKFLNTVFFGEIFLNEGGRATNAYVTGPGDASEGMYFGEGAVLFFAGNRHNSVEDLDAHFPDATYLFNFDTEHGDMRDMPVTFSKKGQVSRHPDPIKITLHQNGEVAHPDSIDPNKDLRVTWGEFKDGAADPNGIIDDMIYVILGNCHGEKIVHSGPAFNDGPSLTYESKDFVIPKEDLSAGQIYQLEVEMSEMDTDRYEKITSIVTYAASTFLDIKATGAYDRNMGCPAQPIAMDGGQTDRVKRKN